MNLLNFGSLDELDASNELVIALPEPAIRPQSALIPTKSKGKKSRKDRPLEVEETRDTASGLEKSVSQAGLSKASR